MGLLDGKNTVILGASSGIGWRIAERFAEEGANLLIAARRLDNLKKLGKQIDASVTRCDVTDFDDVGRLAETAKERLGSVEVAVNSSGIVAGSLIRDITPEILKPIVEVDYFGAIYFMRHFGNAIAESGGGSLINITSATAIMIPLRLTPYSGAKEGINFVTKIAAREYGPDQVRVNALAPTFVPTAMNNYGGGTPIDEARVDLPDEAPTAQYYINESPLGRYTTVDDCADVAVMLASDLSASMTGQVVPVDCGNTLMRLPDIPPRSGGRSPSGTTD